MKVTWLAQSGILFENSKLKIMIDPYFSDAVAEKYPEKKRKFAVPEEYYSVNPDVILVTHEHVDHLDMETLGKILENSDKSVTLLCSESAYNKAVTLGGNHNYVLLSPHSVWSVNGVTFYSVRAEHTDRTAVGFIIDDGKQTYYVSGDTLYNYEVIDDVLDLAPDGVDYAFLPINGRGNNMNARDAADFAYEIGAKCAIPTHYGLVDDITPEEFDFDDRLILEPFKEVKI